MKQPAAKGKEQTTFTASDLQEGVKDILDRVQFKGERLIVTRWGRPAAALSPLSPEEIEALEESAA